MASRVELGDVGGRDFPELPTICVERPHLIETLGQLLTADSPVVFVEGEPGSGRTTLCAQFAKANSGPTFHLFVRASSKLAYSSDYLRQVLAEQYLAWIPSQQGVPDIVDVSEYEAIVLKLRKFARNQPLTFVVDGIDDIPKEDQRFVEQIFREVLPLGVEPFRFVIAANQESSQPYLKKVKSKSFQAVRLSPAESEMILESVCPDRDLRSQLEVICKGNPGRLWSVRRLLQSGADPRQILQADPSKLLEFVRLEFAQLDELGEKGRLIVAALAFGRQDFGARDLSRVCKVTETEVEELVRACIFLRINEQTSAVEFLSETHRHYAARRLEDLKSHAIALQIDSLREDPMADTAVRLLPSYYQQARNQRAIVDLLSPEHYQRLLEVTQSISALKLRAALGARSAEEINEVASVFRFALQRSIFSAIGDVSRSQSEVEALVALGEPQRALEIAAQASAKESRLAMLASYGRKVVEGGGEVDNQTLAFIRETSDQIDFAELGDQAGEIASNLVFVDADLAFKIVDLSSQNQGQDRKDQAFARFSVSALTGGSEASGGVLRAARERVSDKSLQLMLASMGMLAEKFTLDEVREVADAMEITRRVHFLKALAVSSASKASSLDVVEYALDQIIKETGYAPKPGDLSDLAYPLTRDIGPPDKRARLLKRLEGQLALVGKVATSIETVKVQLRIAHAEYILGIDDARARILDAYYEAATIENLEIRVECLALMLNAVIAIDKSGELERGDGFREVIASDLRAGIDALLDRTAQHFQVAKSSVRAVSRVSPRDALQLAGRLNTRDRRARAYAELVSALVSQEHSVDRESVLLESYERIGSPELRDSAFVAACRTLGSVESAREWVGALSGLIPRVVSAESVCEGALCLLKLPGEWLEASAASDLEACVAEAVERIESHLEQADVLFALSAVVAKADPVRAASYFDRATGVRSQLVIDSDAGVEIINLCLSLLARALRPLARHGLLSEDLVGRYVRLAEMFPDSVARAVSIADLVHRVWCEGRVEQATSLVKRHCIPLLEASSDLGSAVRADMSYVLFPAVYFTHRAMALGLLDALSSSRRESAIADCLRMIVRKVTPSDPSAPADDGPPAISYSDALEAIELLRLCKVDSLIYQGLAEIAKAVIHPDNKYKISAVQRRDVATKLSEVAVASLPDAENIQHIGYLVVAQAQIGRMNDEKEAYWAGLLGEAAKVPNIADRAFVFMEIAQCLPGKLAKLKASALESAAAMIADIPAGIDKFSRLEYYVEMIRGVDVIAAKNALREAVQITCAMPQRDQVSKCRREIADLAESIEPGLAEKLADAIDDDPARLAAKGEMKSLSRMQKVRRQIAQAGDGLGDEALSVNTLPVAAWKNTGALLAGRLTTQQPSTFVSFLVASGGFSLHDAYPVLAWFLENSARRFTTVEMSSQFNEPLAEALLVSAELGANVLSQVQAKRHQGGVASGGSPGMLVRHRDREAAFAFIASWLRDSSGSRVILCDPYFGAGEVDFVATFGSEAGPEAKLIVITSRTTTKFDVEKFNAAWRRKYDQDPPNVEVIVASGEGGEDVLHDRWLVSDSGGLRLGTSINSIGRGKLSEISVLEPGRDGEILAQLCLYANRTRVVDGRRMQYVTFQL